MDILPITGIGRHLSCQTKRNSLGSIREHREPANPCPALPAPRARWLGTARPLPMPTEAAGRRAGPAPSPREVSMEIPDHEIVPEPDVHDELERLEATRRWRALEIERRRERAAARLEW